MNHQKTNLLLTLLLNIFILGANSKTMAQTPTPLNLALLNGTWIYEGDGFKEGDYQLEEGPAFLIEFSFTINTDQTSGTIQNKTLSQAAEKLRISQKEGVYFLEYIDRKKDKKHPPKASIVVLSDTELQLLFEEKEIMEYFSKTSK